jgi:hypothetical protein
MNKFLKIWKKYKEFIYLMLYIIIALIVVLSCVPVM